MRLMDNPEQGRDRDGPATYGCPRTSLIRGDSVNKKQVHSGAYRTRLAIGGLEIDPYASWEA